MKRLPSGDELRRECELMGITRAGSEGPDVEHILQTRYMLARAHKRQEFLVWVAIASAVASAISAAAAWVAVLR